MYFFSIHSTSTADIGKCTRDTDCRSGHRDLSSTCNKITERKWDLMYTRIRMINLIVHHHTNNNIFYCLADAYLRRPVHRVVIYRLSHSLNPHDHAWVNRNMGGTNYIQSIESCLSNSVVLLRRIMVDTVDCLPPLNDWVYLYDVLCMSSHFLRYLAADANILVAFHGW